MYRAIWTLSLMLCGCANKLPEKPSGRENNARINFEANFTGERVVVWHSHAQKISKVFDARVVTRPSIGVAEAVHTQLSPNDVLVIEVLRGRESIARITLAVPDPTPKICLVRFMGETLKYKWVDKTPLYD